MASAGVSKRGRNDQTDGAATTATGEQQQQLNNDDNNIDEQSAAMLLHSCWETSQVPVHLTNAATRLRYLDLQVHQLMERAVTLNEAYMCVAEKVQEGRAVLDSVIANARRASVSTVLAQHEKELEYMDGEIRSVELQISALLKEKVETARVAFQVAAANATEAAAEP